MRKKVLILFSVICIFVILLFVIFNFILYPTKYKSYVLHSAEKYGIDKALVYAVIKAESDFDELAVSRSGAIGLMQILPSTGKWIADELGKDDFVVDELYYPEINVEFGCFYLDYLKQKFSDINAVICAYNAGETIVRGWLDENGVLDESKIEYLETKKYLKRVTGFLKVYKIHEICV